MEVKRLQVHKHHKELLEICNKTYSDILTELFFLQHGGNYVEYTQFKKRPSHQLSSFFEQNPLSAVEINKYSSLTNSAENASSHIEVELKAPSTRNEFLAASRSLSRNTKQPGDDYNVEAAEDVVGSQEEILERAKQEAAIQRRVAELRKQGLWSLQRMPKVHEPLRNKTHWDYLLEEMRWLATDFTQERKWKHAAAKKLAKMVGGYHRDAEERERRAMKDEQQKVRRVALNISRMVKTFWSDIEKVVEYKQQCLLDEKRKKALDLHLNFIVDQTAKYSDWVTQGLAHDSTVASPAVSKPTSGVDSDGEFLPVGASSDDEETIAVEEQEEQTNVLDEVALLKQESEMPFADFVAQLPDRLLEELDDPEKAADEIQGDELSSSDEPVKRPSISLRRSARKRHSEEEAYHDKKLKLDEIRDRDTEDVVSPCNEEYSVACKKGDHYKEEIERLEAEGTMPIEDLIMLYHSTQSGDSDDSGSSENDDSTEAPSNNSDDEVGMDFLLKTEEDMADDQVGSEMEKVASEAMSLQPTGHTLATTQVVTPIPTLLRHTLREYQHIGLDWLVTMYNKRLNGILADEMGLGKTIQTIALLAHLACEKGVWGPHLIVVPTSVMLNWEMELKKWCPGFKILTYYGSQKERKMKRLGWTKSNAFHVCITSYKLVLQDHSSFRRKKWRYLILDEAQNIKNFKSQRWQALLNFNSQRRLLLTGTPLQNNLMELWSLMHFLMPHVFQSHKDFKDWFANPLTGMIEGSQAFNEKLILRLHKVLRPFLLRRVKKDVEKQMPEKYEHIVRCSLSKRQRFLYEDFMSRSSTKETLADGHFMSVINILMQLRKVCNHPNLFEPRPIISSFIIPPIQLHIPSLVHKVLEKNVFQEFDLTAWNLHLLTQARFSSHHLESLNQLKISEEFIERSDIESSEVGEKSPPIHEAVKATIKGKLFNMNPARLVQLQPAQVTRSYFSGSSSTTADPCKSDLMSLVTFNKPGLMSSSSYAKALVKSRRGKQDATLTLLAKCNGMRCDVGPTYLPSNLVKLLESLYINCNTCFGNEVKQSDFIQVNLHEVVLAKLRKTAVERMKGMHEELDRFLCVVPKVTTASVQVKVSHPTSWRYHSLTSSQLVMLDWLTLCLTPLHKIMLNAKLLFPETRLIEYDCGKLQVLDSLLRRFWMEKHRVLIFTQMTKVLDILEVFLNYHGYKYLRLDGSTSVEQRMSRMERFNNDSRIFCFILSTRSGGIGVNLTGADTVVFYDSDWNPTMDAQAQDRCHRIGQTRDVHIYRLISERTVEENILKKANQKRLLGDLAIEGGGFTTAFFKQQQIKDLFAEPSGLEELVNQPQQQAEEPGETSSDKAEKEDETIKLEEALLQNEEREDVDAAVLLKMEQNAVLEEFKDSEEKAIINGEEEARLPEESHLEAELEKIYTELNPIERYALLYVEAFTEDINDKELQKAEEQVQQSKKEWELNHLLAMKEEEERKTEEADDIFYTKDDNQVFMDELMRDPMPLWFPPTPPQDDMLFDECDFLLYSCSAISEDKTQIHNVKKELKQTKIESGISYTRRRYTRFDVKLPRSLFSRQYLSKSGDVCVKALKLKNPVTHSSKTLHNTAVSTPTMQATADISKPTSNFNPEWIANEDCFLIQVVQQILEMPLSLSLLMPAHTPNWHLVADLVNSVSCVYRCPKDCRLRYESIIVQREEGKSLSPKKKYKGLKFPVKPKPLKSQRVHHLHTTDGNQQFSSLYHSRFDACKMICNKRIPPKPATGSGQFQRNPKHTNILHEYGISYDQPLHPMQVAAVRGKRLASAKKSSNEQMIAVATTRQVNLTPNPIPMQTGGTFIVTTPTEINTTSLPASTTSINPLSAIPLTGGPLHTRRHTNAPGNNLQVGKSTAAQVSLHPLPGTIQHFPMPQPSPSGPIVSLTFTAQSPVVTTTNAPTPSSNGSRPTITYHSQGDKTSALHQIRQAKQISNQTTTKQFKQVGVAQQTSIQQANNPLISVSPTIVGSKKVQVHLAPIQAQVQAQQVRSHAAQQAVQQTSKSFPIAVPVSSFLPGVGTNVTSPFQQKSLQSSVSQAAHIHSQLIFEQRLLKQRHISQQQQSRQTITAKPQKAVYASVSPQHVVVSAGTSAVKMTPQIQAHMLNQIRAQQKQQQRRMSTKIPGMQPPMTLTVTRLLQNASIPAAQHSIAIQGTHANNHVQSNAQSELLPGTSSLLQPVTSEMTQQPNPAGTRLSSNDDSLMISQLPSAAFSAADCSSTSTSHSQ